MCVSLFSTRHLQKMHVTFIYTIFSPKNIIPKIHALRRAGFRHQYCMFSLMRSMILQHVGKTKVTADVGVQHKEGARATGSDLIAKMIQGTWFYLFIIRTDGLQENTGCCLEMGRYQPAVPSAVYSCKNRILTPYFVCISRINWSNSLAG